MNRKFGIGDEVICKQSGVIGTVVKFYTPTSCTEQTMVDTGDGRLYHAPTSEWMPVQVCIDISHGNDCTGNLLNPYGEYVVNFARNHGLSISEAYEQPMVKARLDYFNQTGR